MSQTTIGETLWEVLRLLLRGSEDSETGPAARSLQANFLSQADLMTTGSHYVKLPTE